jgi:ADP-ribosylglycohydrolase
MMNDNARAMVMGSFVADSLALGAHWIYDTAVIDNTIGKVDGLLPPPADGFHPTKKRGEFTHYGDQTMVLLACLAEKGFEISRFAQDWRSFFSDYTDNFRQGAQRTGSSSTDLGGAVRIAPLVYALQNDPDAMVAAVREQTAMTHGTDPVIRAAEFLARVTHRVLSGQRPQEAVESQYKQGFNRGDFGQWIEDGLASTGLRTRETVKAFGQHCAVSAALPAVVHLVCTYEADLESALVENVMAGGDSAARGMAAGMILGAAAGFEAIPERWIADLVAKERIGNLLDLIDRGADA